MSRLKTDKLFVEYRGVTPTEPVIPRRYTLTHSDLTGDLFLTIGREFAWDKINPMRDEVLAEWRKVADKYYLYVYLLVDGQFGVVNASIRNNIFRRELPLALEAIRYGDRRFFDAHKELDESPIIVAFNSSIPYFNRVENWGTPSMYNYDYNH